MWHNFVLLVLGVSPTVYSLPSGSQVQVQFMLCMGPVLGSTVNEPCAWHVGSAAFLLAVADNVLHKQTLISICCSVHHLSRAECCLVQNKPCPVTVTQWNAHMYSFCLLISQDDAYCSGGQHFSLNRSRKEEAIFQSLDEGYRSANSKIYLLLYICKACAAALSLGQKRHQMSFCVP